MVNAIRTMNWSLFKFFATRTIDSMENILRICDETNVLHLVSNETSFAAYT